jgi:hypothetical protein
MVGFCPGDMFTEEQNELVESAAEMLYGLIHVRYILTSKGMSAMVNILIIFWYILFVFIACFVRILMLNLYSWRSTKTMTLEDVQEYTAVDNPAFQLVNLTFLVQAL